MAPLKTITGSERTAPPGWAVLERQLIDAIDAAAPVFLEKYTRPGGALVWREDYPGDGVWADDLYEAFFNWPHYHALGGSDYTGVKSFEQWNAVTRQVEHDYGRAHKEFISDDDWFHNAENYIYFYHLGMADPTSRETMRRGAALRRLLPRGRPRGPQLRPAAPDRALAVQRQQGAAGERPLQRRPLQHRARARHPRSGVEAAASGVVGGRAVA